MRGSPAGRRGLPVRCRRCAESPVSLQHIADLRDRRSEVHAGVVSPRAADRLRLHSPRSFRASSSTSCSTSSGSAPGIALRWSYERHRSGWEFQSARGETGLVGRMAEGGADAADFWPADATSGASTAARVFATPRRGSTPACGPPSRSSRCRSATGRRAAAVVSSELGRDALSI